MWAQRQNTIFLTICLEDCKNPTLNIETDKIYFKGVGGTDKKEHEVTINLYKEIDPESSAKAVRGRNIEMVLKKKEGFTTYWPQLTKDKQKYHWLKVDFNRWKDEDSEDEAQENDLEEALKSLGGLSGDGDKPSFDDMDGGGSTDSDDEEIPYLGDE
jgi:prostaglandin-E synthase